MKICVFTMTRDRLPYTKRMFQQLKNCGVKYTHVVLDNGSKDGTREWLEKQNDIDVHFSDDNLGLWKGIEMIMYATDNFKGYDYVIKIDNDMEFLEDGWLKKLIDKYKENDFDILSPFVEGVCNGKGGVPRECFENGIGIVPHVGGACLLTTPKFYDEELPNGYMATGWDTWFCTGLRCGIVENIHVKHDSKKMEREYKWYHKRQRDEQKRKYEN